ncbi:sodium/hydrogen exchanger 6, partial [Tanacetum coccineum]
MAPMDLSYSKVKTCSKTCLKNHETLKKQYDDLRIEFNKSEFNLANYKRGLASVEERLIFYKKNELMFCEQIVVLKRDITYKDSNISVLKCEFEKLKKEKESNIIKLNKFENASKSLDKLVGSQISDNSRKGVGFPEFEGYGPKTSKSVSEVEPKKVRKNDGALIIEDWVSDDEEQEESNPMSKKKTVIPAVIKIEFVRPKQQEKPVRKPVKYAEMYRSGPISLNTARQSHFNAVRTNRVNVVKASACWVWRPIKPNSASITLKRYDYVDGNPEIELEDSVRLNCPEDKKVNTRVDNKTLFCSFVYADNYYIYHRTLWSNLVGHAGLMRNMPWVLLGDFNAALNLEDHFSGSYELNIAMRDFKDYVQAMEVSDVNSTGLWGTFNLMMTFRNVNIEGFAMYRVVKRLKGLKSPFRKLLHEHGNLHERVNRLRVKLDEAPKAIDRDHSSFILREEHAHYLLAFKEAQLDEERFLKQKAKIEWLKVPGAFVSLYNQFLKAEGVNNPLDDHDLYIRSLNNAKADFMVRNVTNEEIKSVIFSMGDDKAPGPDGFTAAFFKKAWDVVGGDITCAIRDFFSNDDLFLFAHGHPTPVLVIMDALDEFKQVSRLVPSIPKSTAFFYNVPNAIKASILNSMPFAEGTLPVRNKFVSLAGRLHLIRSVLSSMHIYWASVFILPTRIVHDLEQLMQGFLWCQGEMKKGKVKVSRASVCLPKLEGGLDMISNRDIIGLGFSFGDSVPVLINDIKDVILWHGRDAVMRPFSVRHAIHMWLVLKKKLKTQDRLRQWDVGPNTDLNLLRCPLCDLVPNSYDYLFFECSF